MHLTPSVLLHPALCFHPQLEAAEAAGLHDVTPLAAAGVLQAEAVSTAAAGPLEEPPVLQVWGCAAVKQGLLLQVQSALKSTWPMQFFASSSWLFTALLQAYGISFACVAANGCSHCLLCTCCLGPVHWLHEKACCCGLCITDGKVVI